MWTQRAQNDLNGLKSSSWVALRGVKISKLESIGIKIYGHSNMALSPEKSEIFENFENYFFEFSQKQK